MIKIAVFENGFTAVGHAEYAESGQDIVCSAVSAVLQTTAIGLLEFCGAVIDVYNGNYSVHIARPEEYSFMLLRTMVLGIKQIEKEYPNYVQLKEEM